MVHFPSSWRYQKMKKLGDRKSVLRAMRWMAEIWPILEIEQVLGSLKPVQYQDHRGTLYVGEDGWNLSTLFDVGGIFGGVLAGYISDKLKARATTTASFI